MRIPQRQWGVSTDTSLARDIRIVEVRGSTPLCSTTTEALIFNVSVFFVFGQGRFCYIFDFLTWFYALIYKAWRRFLAVYIASSIISSGIASVGTLAIKKAMNGESAYIPLEIMRSILSEYTIGVLFTAAVLFIFFSSDGRLAIIGVNVEIAQFF